ncbi:hypothetical protein [Clostridium botulinum]|nr:hypothetical protein [Clostridium botulinum]EDT84846.1 hypothetical protein CBB_2612 [Clostridium botulinum Bf]
MIIDYKKIIIKLLNKSSSGQVTKKELQKLDKLQCWYLKENSKW